MTQTATSPQRKPLLDEASFHQLLSAAYVLQEHNDRLRAKGFQADFAENLAAIVETQKLIQTLQLDLAAAAELVAERVQKVTNASGTAIGILEKGELFYRAATGSAAIDAGTRLAPDSAMSGDCISRGTALHYPDVTPSLHVHSDLFRRRDVKAFIAVPVYHAGQVAGVLELRFARANSFREAALRTAELMAGLLSEAMVTAARMKWKEALASERQSMLEALERIKPQIERLGNESLGSDSVRNKSVAFGSVASERPAAAKREPAVRLAATCSACGSDFFDESESFCGTCGTARPVAPMDLDAKNFHVLDLDAPGHDISNFELSKTDAPRKADSPWLIPYGQENPTNGNSDPLPIQREAVKEPVDSILTPTIPAAKPQPAPPSAVVSNSTAAHSEADAVPVSAPAPEPVSDSISPSSINASPAQLGPPADFPRPDSLRIVPADLIHADPLSPVDGMEPDPWGSAKKTQQWLQTVKTNRSPRAEWLSQQWQRRRANIYLVMAAVILLVVIFGWGIRPAGTAAAGNSSPTQNSQPQTPPPPQLTLFEKLMVNLGLAEPPPAPVDLGNPEAQVWVDVHTALYYCSGSELFGKTADGKFATQRDAQQDQFEPANRKACP